MSVIVSTTLGTVTDCTISSVIFTEGVLRRVLVSLRTMSACAKVGATSAPPYVYQVGHQFKVLWPNAVANTAEMIPFIARRREANEEMMSLAGSASPLEVAVSFVAQPAHPNSTAIRATRIDFRPKALAGGIGQTSKGIESMLIRHLNFLSGVTRTAVCAVRPHFYFTTNVVP